MLVLKIEIGFLQPFLRLAQIVGHAVERLDQNAELIVRARLHLVAEVARGDLAGALGELRDRIHDAARQVEREPREREGDDERHQEE